MPAQVPVTHVVAVNESLSLIGQRYGVPWESIRDANRPVLLAAQRAYCATNTTKARCNGHNNWGGGIPSGCCPDASMFASGWFNVDLIVPGTQIVIPGKYAPAPVTPPYTPPKPKTDLKQAGMIAGVLLLAYGAYKALQS